MSRWVQHKSGQGEKWEVANEYMLSWGVKSILGACHHTVPKSEYVLVDPPEQWEDVTGECEASEMTKGGEICIDHDGRRVEGNYLRMYRFTKIDGLHNGPAFIVERKRS